MQDIKLVESLIEISYGLIFPYYKQYEEVKKALENIPLGILNALEFFSCGVSLVVGDKGVCDHSIMYKYENTYPWGYPEDSKYIDVLACACFDEKLAIINISKNDYIDYSVYHEVGHLVDLFTNFSSDSKEWNILHKNWYAIWNYHCNNAGGFLNEYYNDPAEAWAESFYAYVVNEKLPAPIFNFMDIVVKAF